MGPFEYEFETTLLRAGQLMIDSYEGSDKHYLSYYYTSYKTDRNIEVQISVSIIYSNSLHYIVLRFIGSLSFRYDHHTGSSTIIYKSAYLEMSIPFVIPAKQQRQAESLPVPSRLRHGRRRPLVPGAGLAWHPAHVRGAHVHATHRVPTLQEAVARVVQAGAAV